MLWYRMDKYHLDVSDLYIYGINLTGQTECSHQKPCVEYWLGRLEERGVKLHIPAASALMKGAKYARDQDDLTEHALDRMIHYKGEFFVEYANVVAFNSMKLEVDHWQDFFNELSEKFPEIEQNKEMVEMISNRLNRRMTLHGKSAKWSEKRARKVEGIAADCQHWLSLVGGS